MHVSTEGVLCFVCVGVVAVFDFHKAANIPDMYSLHSWCGMATFLLFCVQVHLFSSVKIFVPVNVFHV